MHHAWLHMLQWQIIDNGTKGITNTCIYSYVATYWMQLWHVLGLPVSHHIWKEYQIKTYLCCIWYLSCDASCCQLKSSLRLEHVVLARSAFCVAAGSIAFLTSSSKSNDKSELCPATWWLEVTAFAACRDVQVSCGSMLLTWSAPLPSAWDDSFASSVKQNVYQKICNSHILFIIPAFHYVTVSPKVVVIYLQRYYPLWTRAFQSVYCLEWGWTTKVQFLAHMSISYLNVFTYKHVRNIYYKGISGI